MGIRAILGGAGRVIALAAMGSAVCSAQAIELEKEADALASAQKVAETRPAEALAMLAPAAGSSLECETRFSRAELAAGLGHASDSTSELEALPASCSAGLRSEAAL